MTHRSIITLALAIFLAACAPDASAPPVDVEVPRLVVDLNVRSGSFRGAVSGVLYGLSDEGVPSDNVLEPLKIRSIAQKPPAGAQHPNGDALVVADPFFRNGGEYIQIYVQDMYEQWPYENFGEEVPCNPRCLDDYTEKLAWVVDRVAGSPWADRMVYVPFNEPDWLWYGFRTDDPALHRERMDVFLDHWKAAVEVIRSHHDGALIMGMNDTHYSDRNYRDFLTFARDHNVLPDFVSWHQLQSNSLDPSSSNYFRSNYAAYRGLERELGIEPIRININEYGGNRDLTVPGQLIQWVAMLEEAGVDAGGKAYWTVAGSLAGDVVGTNRPGGGWWLYKMYADLHGGDLVQIERPDSTSLDALDALGVIDENRRQARIIAGGTGDAFDVVVHGIDPDLFGSTAHVTLSATTWSGQDAASPPPTVLFADDVRTVNGTLALPIRGLGVHGDGGPHIDRMAAYEIVIAPGGTGLRPSTELPWRAALEAESAEITAGEVATHGTADEWNAAAASGDRDVGGLSAPNSAVTFEVEVPEDGVYILGVLYGNQTGSPSQQVLTINEGQERLLDYGATLHWQYRARVDFPIDLMEGTNRIRLAKSGSNIESAVGEVTLDRIDLRHLAGDGPETARYEAESSQTRGNVEYRYDDPNQSAAGYIRLGGDSEAMFVLYADRNGFHDLTFRFRSIASTGIQVGQLGLDRHPLQGAVLRSSTESEDWLLHHERLFLTEGVNRVTVEPMGTARLDLDRVAVVRVTPGDSRVQMIEAEDTALAGTAEVQTHNHASGGHYVEGIGQGPENRLTLAFEVEEAGEYVLVVHYSNDEREVGHPYNADIVSRPIDIVVNDGPSRRYWFRNTWSWGNWWSRTIAVTLQAGPNTIALFNDPANGVTALECPSPCMQELDSGWAPHLDRFEIAPIRIPIPPNAQEARPPSP